MFIYFICMLSFYYNFNMFSVLKRAPVEAVHGLKNTHICYVGHLYPLYSKDICWLFCLKAQEPFWSLSSSIYFCQYISVVHKVFRASAMLFVPCPMVQSWLIWIGDYQDWSKTRCEWFELQLYFVGSDLILTTILLIKMTLNETDN